MRSARIFFEYSNDPKPAPAKSTVATASVQVPRTLARLGLSQAGGAPPPGSYTPTRDKCSSTRPGSGCPEPMPPSENGAGGGFGGRGRMEGGGRGAGTGGANA